VLETVFSPDSSKLDYDKDGVLSYENIKNLRVFVQTNAESRIKNQKFISTVRIVSYDPSSLLTKPNPHRYQCHRILSYRENV